MRSDCNDTGVNREKELVFQHSTATGTIATVADAIIVW
jgi:hypothetical protein